MKDEVCDDTFNGNNKKINITNDVRNEKKNVICRCWIHVWNKIRKGNVSARTCEENIARK